MKLYFLEVNPAAFSIYTLHTERVSLRCFLAIALNLLPLGNVDPGEDDLRGFKLLRRILVPDHNQDMINFLLGPWDTTIILRMLLADYNPKH